MGCTRNIAEIGELFEEQKQQQAIHFMLNNFLNASIHRATFDKMFIYFLKCSIKIDFDCFVLDTLINKVSGRY